MTAVLVLNASFEPLQRVELKHAIGMLVRGVAVIVEAHDEYFGPFPKPKVLRLVRYVKTAWMYARRHGRARYVDGVKVTWENYTAPVPHYSASGVLRRDGYRCAYCGEHNATTMDHVLPRSQGGPTTWLNAVAACFDCNQAKGPRTPEQAGMPLLWQPFTPTRFDLA